MAEAKTRRLLLLGGAVLLNLAPGAVGDAPGPQPGLPPRPPRPGLIAVSAAELDADLDGQLELEPPDLVALALRVDGGPGLEDTGLGGAAGALPSIDLGGGLAPQRVLTGVAWPVAEPPAAALLGLALGALVARSFACRRLAAPGPWASWVGPSEPARESNSSLAVGRTPRPLS